MKVILTNLEPLRIKDLPDGEISLHELRVWPGWTHPKFKTILTYQLAGEKQILTVSTGKTYTFETLSQLVNDVLNISGIQIINLDHSNGRVTWRVYPPLEPENSKISSGTVKFPRPTNIKLSDEVVKLFKLDGIQADKHGIITGAPVDKASISFCFSDASTLFFTCDECDKNTLINNTRTNVITAIPIAAAIDGSLKADLTHPAHLTFRNNFKNRLSFHIQDEHGNNLPAKKLFCRLSINDERLR